MADPELKAMEKIMTHLDGLEPKAAHRVLEWVQAKTEERLERLDWVLSLPVATAEHPQQRHVPPGDFTSDTGA